MSDDEAAKEVTLLHNEIAAEAAKAGMTVDDFLELWLAIVRQRGR